uniref:hypothetical protein n=1 Tax=uncultured Halomonas sp. TaxID=173971 RepID=UPI002612F697
AEGASGAMGRWAFPGALSLTGATVGRVVLVYRGYGRASRGVSRNMNAPRIGMTLIHVKGAGGWGIMP